MPTRRVGLGCWKRPFFRVPDKIYLPAKTAPAEREETITVVLQRALTEYTASGENLAEPRGAQAVSRAG
jgi:hypothetical protein